MTTLKKQQQSVNLSERKVCVDTGQCRVNWPSYIISLGPAEMLLLQESLGIGFPSPRQTHPAVS